jgi:hypothetical protein
MGKGIELAKSLDPEIAEAMEDLRDQLLIVFLKRLGGVADVCRRNGRDWWRSYDVRTYRKP